MKKSTQQMFEHQHGTGRKLPQIIRATIAFLLCLVMFVEVIPPALIWATSETVQTQSSQKTEEVYEASILCEDPSKRNENKKEYLLSDGSYRAVVYPHPIHYKEDDEWADIDNTLKLDNSEGGYKNTSNDFEVTFAKKSDSKKLVEVKTDDFKLSWGFVNSLSNKTAKKKTRISSTDETALNNLSDGISYQEIYDNVDVEYDLTSKTLKENIIVKNSNAQQTFEIEMKLNGATAVLNDDNSISINLADGTQAGYIAAPFMFDAAGIYNDEIEVSLSQSGNKYTMIIVPSESWISDPSRKYPITIDPQISVDVVSYNEYFAATGNKLEDLEYKENYLCAGSFYNTQLGASDIAIGGLNLYYGPYIYDFQDYIISAKLCVDTVPTGTNLWTGDTYSNTQINKTIELHATSDYSPNYSISNISGAPLDVVNVSVAYPVSVNAGEADSAVKKYSFNILDHIYDQPEHYLDYSCYYLSERDASATASAGTLPVMFTNARIEYEYRSLEGVESQFTYTEATVGGAGTAYIGDASGRLTYAHSILSTPSGVTPITVGSVYNQTDSEQIGYGNGWRTNYSETIRKISSTETLNSRDKMLYDHGYLYVWTDSDGTDIYFHKSKKFDDEGNETSEYEIVDEAGKGIVLTENEDGSITLTDSAQSTAEFNLYSDNKYRLTAKKDHLQNKILVTYYDDTSLKISQLVNDFEETVRFAYDDGLLTEVYQADMANEPIQTVTFSYDQDENVIQITRTDGKRSCFAYDAQNRIEKILDGGTEYMLQIGYTAMGKAIFLQEYAAVPETMSLDTATAGQRMEISYQPNMTAFRTAGSDGVIDNSESSDDILTVYQFDSYGRTVSAYSKSYVGNTFYGAEQQEYTSGGLLFDGTQASNTAEKFKFNKVKSFVSEGNSTQNLLLNSNFELALSPTNTNPATFCGSVFDCNEDFLGGDTISNYITTSVISSAENLSAYAGEKMLKATLADSALSTLTAWYAPIARADALKPSTEYSFSAYVKLDSISVQNAKLCAKIGETEYLSDVVNNASTSQEWQKLELHFTTPEILTDDVLLCLKLTEGGTAYLDCAQLEEGKAANNVNYAENQSFELLDGTTSAVWNSALSTNTLFGERSASVMGNLGETKEISQTIKLSNLYAEKEKRDITFSAWAKADAYLENETYPDRFFGIRARIIYYDENGALTYSEAQKKSFNLGVNDWQYTALTLQTDGEKQLYGVELTLCYNYQRGNCYFDNISVFDNTVTNYEYDANGNLKRTVSGNNETLNTYEGENLVSSVSKKNGEVKNTSVTEYHEAYLDNDIYVTNVLPTHKVNVEANVDENGKVVSISKVNSASQTVYDYQGRVLYTQTGTELLAYYPFIDGSLNDEVEKGPRATLINGVITQDDNSTDYAVQIRNSDDKLSIPHFDIPDYFTLCFEVDLDDKPDPIDFVFYTFLSKYDSNGKKIFSIENCEIPNLAFKTGTETIYTENFIASDKTKIAVTFEEYSDELTIIQLFINGAQVAHSTVADSFDFSNGGDWIFGENIEGVIDNIAFFRGILSKKEIYLWNNDTTLFYSDFTDTAEWTEYTYSEDGRFVVKEERNNGSVTNYTIDDGTGLVLSAVTTTREGVSTRLNYEYNLDKTLKLVYYDSNNNGVKDDTEIFNSYTYDAKGNLISVAHNGTEYDMTYNEFGQSLSFKAGDNTLVSYQYVTDAEGNSINGALKGQSFAGNSQKTENYIYDDTGKVIGREYNGVQTQEWAYDNSGNLIYENDIEDGTKSRYQYDARSRLTQHSSTLLNGNEFTSSYLYNENSNVTESAYYIGDATPLSIVNHYNYDEDNRFILLDSGNVRTETGYNYKTDQITDRTVSLKQTDGSYSQVVSEEYNYYNKTSQGSIKGAISSVVYGENSNVSYTYDSSGNIKTESRNGTLYKTYTYDALGQLIEENIVSTGNRYVYAYDSAGNITSWTLYKTTNGVESLANSAIFGYTDANWGDLLTSYKGTPSYYDAMGNPTSFSDYKFTWKNGRELATVINRNNNVQTASYEYNSSGLRISKTTADDTVYYAYDESNNLIFEKHDDYSMVFHYDGNGVRTHFDYKSAAIDASFYYRYNAQGDVIALLDSTGAIIANYDYTAYGRQIKRSGMISSAVGDRNPFRYRGYYYDNETGLYYLNNRYYDSYSGRFINTSDSGSNNNLFAYCKNDPINTLGSSAIFGAVDLGVGEMLSYIRFPSSDVGAAGEYVATPKELEDSVNCYGFAIGIAAFLQIGVSSGRLPAKVNDVFIMADSIEADLVALGYKFRRLSGMDAKLYNDEIKIAFRVGIEPYKYTTVDDKVIPVYDFHFMVLTKSGQWAHKSGQMPSVLFEQGQNPENISWNYKEVNNYYNSTTIYFAISK